MICLHSFIVKAPSIIPQVITYIEKALQDRDPGVTWAALRVYKYLIEVYFSDNHYYNCG